jgi:hypothetical protein
MLMTIAAALSLIAAGSPADASHALERKTQIIVAIEAMPLPEALQQFAIFTSLRAFGSRTKISFAYDYRDKDVVTRRVEVRCSDACDLQPTAVLDEMLKGTGFHAMWSPKPSGVGWHFTLADGEPLNYCYVWMGAFAPLPPCAQPPLEISAERTYTIEEMIKRFQLDPEYVHRAMRDAEERVRKEREQRERDRGI